MMYSLPTRSRRANVWLDEAPPASFTASSIVKRVVKPKKAILTSHRIAAIEMMLPRGPYIGYALLGGELVESDIDGLEVVVSVNSRGARFKSSLVPMGDEGMIGLEDEYVKGVLAGIEQMNESSGLPSGASLRFRWAAHGEAGSSIKVFAGLSGLVVHLLTLRKGVSEKEITDIVLGWSV